MHDIENIQKFEFKLMFIQSIKKYSHQHCMIMKLINEKLHLRVSTQVNMQKKKVYKEYTQKLVINNIFSSNKTKKFDENSGGQFKQTVFSKHNY